METYSVRIVPTGEDGEIAVYSSETDPAATQVRIVDLHNIWACILILPEE